MSADAVIRSLRKSPNIRIVGCNCHPASWTPSATSVDAFYSVPPASEAGGFLEAILKICETEDIDRIIPLTDPEVDVLNHARDRIETNGRILCLPAKAAIEVCRDKWLLHEAFAEDCNVATIPTWRLGDFAHPPLEFPLLAKPRHGRSSEGIFIIEDQADYDYLRMKREHSKFIVQPRMVGSVCTIDLVRHKHSGSCVAVARKELLRTSNGAGLTVQILRDENLVRTAHRIAERLDINGCINIEFLVHAGQPMLMDINPRFSAGVSFSLLAGYDMIANHLQCFGGATIEPEVPARNAIFAKRFADIMTADLGD